MKLVHLTLLPVLALSLQTSCVAREAQSACSIDGLQYLPSTISRNEACDRFRARVAAVLEEEGYDAEMDAMTMAIELNKNGSAQARIAVAGTGQNGAYPVVALDVMDRPLALRDLDRLADATARMLISRS